MTEIPKILITGGTGMLGSLLVETLRKKYGTQNVVCSDIRKTEGNPPEEPFELCDITNFDQLEGIVVKHGVTWLLNMSAVLSVAGEQNPQLAIKVNIGGFQNLMEVARKHKIRIFSPSATAAFGPETPKELTPDVTVMRPTNIYGVSKVHNELVGEYYHRRFGVDFRCLRFPSIITGLGEGRGRVVDYIVEIFVEAVKSGRYTCDVDEHSRLPFLYLPDCVDGTVRFMETKRDKLKQSTYNVTALSITPSEIVTAIRKYYPEYQVDYKPDPVKMAIINSLPESFDDSNARNDWQWDPKYNLDKIVIELLDIVKAKYCKC